MGKGLPLHFPRFTPQKSKKKYQTWPIVLSRFTPTFSSRPIILGAPPAPYQALLPWKFNSSPLSYTWKVTFQRDLRQIFQTGRDILGDIHVGSISRWWQLKYFLYIFTPKIGEMIQFDEHILSKLG